MLRRGQQSRDEEQGVGEFGIDKGGINFGGGKLDLVDSSPGGGLAASEGILVLLRVQKVSRVKLVKNKNYLKSESHFLKLSISEINRP